MLYTFEIKACPVCGLVAPPAGDFTAWQCACPDPADEPAVMTPDEAGRMRGFAEWLDVKIAGNPELVSSPIASGAATIIGVARANPADVWPTILAGAEALGVVVAWVRDAVPIDEAKLDAFLGTAPPA